jgi:hypothetical protein
VSVIRFAGTADAADPDCIASLLGPVRTLSREPLVTSGYTSAQHERITVTLTNGEVHRLVVKRVRPAADWMAQRSGDRLGREAMLLSEPVLAAVWDEIACPYLAYWSTGTEIGLVMNDLTPGLFPDVRAPLRLEEEERLLTALAGMHARFWNAPALDLPWLARAESYVGLLDAESGASPDALAALPVGLRERVQQGWAIARTRLPRSVTAALSRPAFDTARDWARLPRTLLHGDAKVANFALQRDHRVAAFDWALLGSGPVTVDLGWYLAVNASRLARSKDEVLDRYRALLTERLGSPLTDSVWDELVGVAVIAGARMLLWSKALALEAAGPGSSEEWAWWVTRLEARA